MDLSKKAYYELLNRVGWNPVSYKDIANCLMKNVVVHEADIPLMFSITNLKIFWCCRCHLVAKDKSTAHEHLHALVQYHELIIHHLHVLLHFAVLITPPLPFHHDVQQGPNLL